MNGFEHLHQAAWTGGGYEETVGPVCAADIDFRNGWAEPGDAETLSRKQRYEIAANLLGSVCAWLAKSTSAASAGRRAICLSYVLRPDLFDAGCDVRSIAKAYGGTAQSYSKYSKEILHLSHGVFVKGNCLSESQRRVYSTPHGGAVSKREPKGKTRRGAS